ncbi:MAG: hypothetical protein M3O34_08075 [Chloroflexota bacterium]|nr:hypothetical protein [Chloroflexota bacterium]
MTATDRVVLRLDPREMIGSLGREETAAPIRGATWYYAATAGDDLEYRFAAGALAAASHLTADLLLGGEHLAVFRLRLQEGANGPGFDLIFGALNRCAARIWMPLVATNQDRWRYEREGAWLKPTCAGDRVDLAKVDRMTLTVLRKSERPVRWCLTSFVATAGEPPRVAEPLLPNGPLLDELGQSTIHIWPTKSGSVEEVAARLRDQLAATPGQRWPAGFSRWGGWHGRRVEASGFFRTHHDGRRWWLVDPDGFVFWSAGLDCVRPSIGTPTTGLAAALSWLPDPGGPYAAAHGRDEDGAPSIDYLVANLIRAFGPERWRGCWAEIALAELRRLGFSTVGNWSDWRVASAARVPYVRPLDECLPRTPLVYRDFPDVFDPIFEEDAAAYAEQLRETADDPALIGYFLMNEPRWGFATETPAAGMRLNGRSSASRAALGEFLRDRYGSDERLAAAWQMPVTLGEVAGGEWRRPLTAAAQADLTEFSRVMVGRLFGGLSAACRRVDPRHLNLGARYHTVPPAWALAGMGSFDVFSMNGYDRRIPAERLERISGALDRPVLIGEWHFGALDAGLPSGGISHVRDQAARGRAFRVYAEDAAAHPSCVGAHYFQMYDQSALGRFDGENGNIGFLDVCHRPYAPLAAAARASHERIYSVALGQAAPYDDAPEYLPRLFL